MRSDINNNKIYYLSSLFFIKKGIINSSEVPIADFLLVTVKFFSEAKLHRPDRTARHPGPRYGPTANQMQIRKITSDWFSYYGTAYRNHFYRTEFLIWNVIGFQKKNYYQKDGSHLKFQNRGTNNWKTILHNYSTLTYRKADQFRHRKQ
jgi:hypothetical protein